MIYNWNVLQHVARRYGKLEPVFEESAKKLQLVKEGTLQLTSMEDNKARLKMRLAREHLSPNYSLERITGTPNFQDVCLLDKISLKAKAVCRILKRGNPVGTGFLVSENIILTNHHVISSPGDAEDMLAEFNFELDTNLVPRSSSCFRMAAENFFLTSDLENNPNIPNSGLDFTFIELMPTGVKGELLNQIQPVNLDGNLGKIIKGEACVIIQHPEGLHKKVVLKDIGFFSETNTRIVYESDTLPGSSGSMVLGLDTSEVIALHHSGLPRTDDQNRVLTRSGDIAVPGTPDHEIDWLGNEGIKISKILQALNESVLPPEMENGKNRILRKTMQMANQLASVAVSNVDEQKMGNFPLNQVENPKKDREPVNQIVSSIKSTMHDFLITVINTPGNIKQVEKILTVRYNKPINLSLAMPSSSDDGEEELFYFNTEVAGNNVFDEANELLKVPGILYAEADIPLLFNADTTRLSVNSKNAKYESFKESGKDKDERNEDEFLIRYAKSKYVNKNDLARCRKWNWEATGFDKALSLSNISSPTTEGIRIVQFDTGYTEHSKVTGGFDLDKDFNFISNSYDAADLRNTGIGKFPGHGTRTASLLIGNADLPLEYNGNIGLLTKYSYKLVPYRIAETVILINRQRELAAAVDKAIEQGFDIITMSMGLPPTIANAKMAKKAYDKGVIWCCAAGNVVQAVVAPAVYPGTIAVAASNPLDEIWKGSSRGDTVDITAPGEDIYVPIWNDDNKEDFSYGNGTSYATPHVAAAAAYWLAINKVALNSPAYYGWRRVEAFRKALKDTARRPDGFPKRGLGSGILNTEALLKTKPKYNELVYAYDGWNEHAFLASLQGWGELVKTYWNRIHNWFGGKEESLQSQYAGTISSSSRQLEEAILQKPKSIYESGSEDSDMTRYQEIMSLLQQAK